MGIEMRTLHRCLILLALATYFLVGGAAGLCSVWIGLGVEHHHGAHASDSHSAATTSICGNHADHCDKHERKNQLPCRHNADHDGDQFLALSPDSPAPISAPLSGVLATPTADFSVAAPTPQAVTVPACLLGSVRGSPPRPSALLCRFVV